MELSFSILERTTLSHFQRWRCENVIYRWNSAIPVPLFIQPSAFSRRGLRPSFAKVRAAGEARARGTPGPVADKFTISRKPPDRTRGLRRLAAPKRDDAFDEAPSGVVNRKSAISPASRARCLKPALHDPRWTDLSGTLGLRRGAYPPL